MIFVVSKTVLISLIVFVVVSCGKSEAQQTTFQPSSNLPPSGKNEVLDAKAANCAKVTDINKVYKIEIAQKYGVPVASVRFLRINGGCMMTIDTAQGPKECGVGGMLWYKTGQYDAISAVVRDNQLVSGFGAVSCL